MLDESLPAGSNARYEMMRLTIPVLVAGLAFCTKALGGLYSYTNTVNTSIPSGGSTLSSGQVVSGLPPIVQDINVRLNITGGWNGDLYGYLRFESASSTNIAVLLNRVGRASSGDPGYGDAGFLVTLSDQADTDIHIYGGNQGNQLTGTWKPDGRDANPGNGVTDDIRGALLGNFNGINPNGTWTLVFTDMVSEYPLNSSTLVSWTLDINAVPEPVNVALAVFGICGVGVGIGRRIYLRARA